jgi:NitT/TauT family transport system permease protein
MVGILVLTALAVAGAVGRIDKRLMRWQPAAGKTEKL